MEDLLPNAKLDYSQTDKVPILLNFEETFDVIEELGSGSYGKVYLVQNRDDENYYALKITRGRDLNEVDAGEAIKKCCSQNPNLMQYYGNFYILEGSEYSGYATLLEYIEGETLGDYSEDASEEDIRRIMRWIIETIRDLNAKGLIYEDLHDENIMIMPDGTVKLIDYGAICILSRRYCRKSRQDLLLIDLLFILVANLPDNFAEFNSALYQYSENRDNEEDLDYDLLLKLVEL